MHAASQKTEGKTTPFSVHLAKSLVLYQAARRGGIKFKEDCCFSQVCVAWLQLLTDVHQPLLELVVAEAFEAAINVAGQENLDVRLHEMRYAMPPSNKVSLFLTIVIEFECCLSQAASGACDTGFPC